MRLGCLRVVTHYPFQIPPQRVSVYVKTRIFYGTVSRSLEGKKITAVSNLCISNVAWHSEAPSEIKVIYKLNKTSMRSGGDKRKHYI